MKRFRMYRFGSLASLFAALLFVIVLTLFNVVFPTHSQAYVQDGDAAPGSTMADYTQQSRLATGGAGDGFANDTNSVMIDGNTAIVNSYLGWVVLVRSGSIWSQQAVLVPSDGNGESAALDGNTIVIGRTNTSIAPGQFQGAAYVFVRNGTVWTEQQRLVASDRGDGDSFGGSVAIKGDTIVVGSTGDDVGTNTDQGSVYVFVRSGSLWSEQAKLIGNDSVSSSKFGTRVGIDGNTIISSAATGLAARIGVYVFVRNGTSWGQQQKFSVCDPGGVCRFGLSIAVSGDTIAVGSDWVTVSGLTIVGAVYVYSRNGTAWTQDQKITPADGLAGDHYGYSVGLAGDSLVVGSHGNGNHPGAAYIYNRNGTSWSLSQPRIQVTPTESNNLLGWGVSIDRNRSSIIIGVPRDVNVSGSYIGAAYVYIDPSVTPTPTRAKAFDYDGDQKADMSVFRPSTGTWFLDRPTIGFTGYPFGAADDSLAPADFTGDGKTDVAVWRPSDGFWYILRSEDNSFYGVGLGTSGDVPVPGDYDGDGKSDQAVFQPSTGTWLMQGSTAGFAAVQFGAGGDLPTIGDLDGDGKSDVAVFRPSEGVWYRLNSSNSSFTAIQFGAAGDKVVPSDYTGDGKTDIAVWRPSNGTWYILKSEDLSFYGLAFGTSGDLPAPGDYDGDGKADIAVFRPSDGNWHMLQSTAGFATHHFGVSEDRPTPGAYVY